MGTAGGGGVERYGRAGAGCVCCSGSQASERDKSLCAGRMDVLETVMAAWGDLRGSLCQQAEGLSGGRGETPRADGEVRAEAQDISDDGQYVRVSWRMANGEWVDGV